MSERPPRQTRFLVLGGREIRIAGNAIHCRVELLHDGTPFPGEARDIDTETGRARAAARATLAAASDAVGPVLLALEGVTFLSLFGRRHVALSVEASAHRHTTRLSGIAAVRPTIEDAACLAALDATDRWLAGQSGPA